MRCAGHAVDILPYHEGEDIRIENLRVLRIRKPPGVSGVPIGFSWKKFVCDLWLLGRRLRSVRYDIVQAVEESVFPALLARRRFDFQLVYDMNSIMSDPLAQKWPLMRTVGMVGENRSAAGGPVAHLLLAVCPAIADYACAFGRAEHVRVVPDAACPATDPGATDARADAADAVPGERPVSDLRGQS